MDRTLRLRRIYTYRLLAPANVKIQLTVASKASSMAWNACLKEHERMFGSTNIKALKPQSFISEIVPRLKLLAGCGIVEHLSYNTLSLIATDVARHCKHAHRFNAFERLPKMKLERDLLRFGADAKLEPQHQRVSLPKIDWVQYRDATRDQPKLVGAVKRVTVFEKDNKWYMAVITVTESEVFNAKTSARMAIKAERDYRAADPIENEKDSWIEDLHAERESKLL